MDLPAENIQNGNLAKERLPTAFEVQTNAASLTIDASGNILVNNGVLSATTLSGTATIP